jgi:hypothetical protein
MDGRIRHRLQTCQDLLGTLNACPPQFNRSIHESNQWRSQIYGMGERFTLESIGLKMAVTDLYRGTSLELAI